MAIPEQHNESLHRRDDDGKFTHKPGDEAPGGTGAIDQSSRGVSPRYSESHPDPPLPGYIHSGVRKAVLDHWHNTDGLDRAWAAESIQQQAGDALFVVQLDHVVRTFEEQSDHSINKIFVDTTYDFDGAVYAMSSYEDEEGNVHFMDDDPTMDVDTLNEAIIDSGLLDDDRWYDVNTAAFGLTIEETQ